MWTPFVASSWQAEKSRAFAIRHDRTSTPEDVDIALDIDRYDFRRQGPIRE
jgi:hypothetical protein